MGVAIHNFFGAQTEADLMPAEDYLLVECAPPEQETKLGIIVPGQQSDEDDGPSLNPIGKVLKAGKGYFSNDGSFVEQPYQKGDIVYFRTSDYAAMAPQYAPCGDGNLAVLVRSRSVYAFVRIDKVA